MLRISAAVLAVSLCACGGSASSTDPNPTPETPAVTPPGETPPTPETKKNDAPSTPTTPVTPATPSMPEEPENPVVPACPGAVAPVQLKAFGGTSTIRGTVTLPPGSSGKYVQLVVAETFSSRPRISFGNSFEYAQATSDSIVYEVHGAKLGSQYWIEAYVNDANRVNVDTADGYYAGGAATPTGPNDATAIVLTSATPNVCNADFTVGPIACYASPSESCRFDDDCRSTFCKCPGAASYYASTKTGSCVDSVCTQLACPAGCAGAEPIASIGNCIDHF